VAATCGIYRETIPYKMAISKEKLRAKKLEET